MDVCNAEYLMKKAVGWIMIAYIFMRAIIVGTRLLWGQFGILPSMWGQNKKNSDDILFWKDNFTSAPC